MVLADHAAPTQDQTTSEEHALTPAQIRHTSTYITVNARSAQYISELIKSKETASEITASLPDNTSMPVVSANNAKPAQEP